MQQLDRLLNITPKHSDNSESDQKRGFKPRRLSISRSVTQSRTEIKARSRARAQQYVKSPRFLASIYLLKPFPALIGKRRLTYKGLRSRPRGNSRTNLRNVKALRRIDLQNRGPNHAHPTVEDPKNNEKRRPFRNQLPVPTPIAGS